MKKIIGWSCLVFSYLSLIWFLIVTFFITNTEEAFEGLFRSIFFIVIFSLCSIFIILGATLIKINIKKIIGWSSLVFGYFWLILSMVSCFVNPSAVVVTEPFFWSIFIIIGAILINSGWCLLIPIPIYLISFALFFFVGSEDIGFSLLSFGGFSFLFSTIPLLIVGAILMNKNKDKKNIDVKQKSNSEKLKDLENMLNDKLISEEEYKEKRKKIIDNI